MSERASFFEADEDDLDVTDFRPAAAPRPRDAQTVEAVRRTAEAKGFPSREATPTPPVPAPVLAPLSTSPTAAPVLMPQEARLRRRRTGRDKQLNLKVTEASLNQLYAIADAHGWGLGETFERALEALEVELTNVRGG